MCIPIMTVHVEHHWVIVETSSRVVVCEIHDMRRKAEKNTVGNTKSSRQARLIPDL